LNPHASDGGLMGTEEIQEIIPAIEKARADGLNVEGPIPGYHLSRGKPARWTLLSPCTTTRAYPVKLMDSYGWASLVIGKRGEYHHWPAIIRVSVTMARPLAKPAKAWPMKKACWMPLIMRY